MKRKALLTTPDSLPLMAAVQCCIYRLQIIYAIILYAFERQRKFMSKSVIAAVVISAITAGMLASVIGQVAYAGPGACPKCFHHGHHGHGHHFHFKHFHHFKHHRVHHFCQFPCTPNCRCPQNRQANRLANKHLILSFQTQLIGGGHKWTKNREVAANTN